MTTIYDRIKEISNKKGVSIDYVNDKAGLSNKAIYGWKKSTPKADNLQKVADVLHVSTDYLLGRT
ncbi:helix-turn-helix domain-containing protein, partial [Leuconostoc falkenbergense]